MKTKNVSSQRGVAIALTLFGTAACASCGSSGSITEVSGAVTVDGAPIEIGAISLSSSTDSRANGAGGPISDGRFTMILKETLSPGTFTVAVNASRKTGRVIHDPQRGEVPESVPLNIANSPQEVEITADNATSLSLEFTSAK